MKKIAAYFTIMQETLLTFIAYSLGARPYAVNIRYTDSNIFAPFTDVLINKYQEEATSATAISKFDDFEATIYPALPIESVKINPISLFEYLKNRCVEILIFAS